MTNEARSPKPEVCGFFGIRILDFFRYSSFVIVHWSPLFLAASTFASGFSAIAPLPTEPELSRDPARTAEWADRILARDLKVRTAAEAALVEGQGRSFPLLRQFLDSRNEGLHEETFEIIRRIGPAGIPLLKDALQHHRASIRRNAADALIDLAPETAAIQPELRRALRDPDSFVARDAARALGALGEKAAPSVTTLVKALSHEEPHVRIYAAEALASIGAQAASGRKELARTLNDPVPGVRWAACEALASIGPKAESAVPRLIEALKDEYLYVRICAAGALGSIRPKGPATLEALRAAAKDPLLREEAQWALNQIRGQAYDNTGSVPDSRAQVSLEAALTLHDRTFQCSTIGGSPTTVLPTGKTPLDWDIKTGRNITWSVELGDQTFGRPVVAGDTVYIGTDNGRRLDTACQEDCGVLMAFRAKDGAFLWQDPSPRVKRGLREFLLPSTTSAPHVEESRLYYVTAECQLRCLDIQDSAGFQPAAPPISYGQTPGIQTVSNPSQNVQVGNRRYTETRTPSIVWELDMCARLGVFPHEAANSEVLPVGDLLIVSTSNGQNEGHTRVPSPRAPSVIAVDKRSGEVVWRAIGAGEHVLHGQWCSPVAANVNGRVQVLFGGGDGRLRAYDAVTGYELWSFDGNPKDARWLPRPGVLSRSSIIASPVFADGRVFIAMGQDPIHGDGPSLLHAINPNGQGDVTVNRLLWTSREVGRVVGTPVLRDGLLYVGDLGGTLHCLDAATGTRLWKHDTSGAIWGCLCLSNDRVYVGNVEGGLTVLRAGRQKELLAQIEMDAPLYSRPALADNGLYLATAHRLYLIGEKL